MILSDDDCAAFLDGLGELDDIRQAPTVGRHGQFLIDWRDATESGRRYTVETLKGCANTTTGLGPIW